jgi:hypothetical protein
MIQVISLVSNITKNLVLTGPSINDLSLAKAEVDTKLPDLRGLLTEQRQFIQDLNELLEIKNELEMYMKSIFQNMKQLADLHIAFLIKMERNLLRPSAEHKWTPAFNYLLRYSDIEAASHVSDRTARTSIQLWMKEGHFRDNDKIRALLARCLEIMPTRTRRVSALFAFSEVCTNRYLIPDDSFLTGPST